MKGPSKTYLQVIYFYAHDGVFSKFTPEFYYTDYSIISKNHCVLVSCLVKIMKIKYINNFVFHEKGLFGFLSKRQERYLATHVATRNICVVNCLNVHPPPSSLLPFVVVWQSKNSLSHHAWFIKSPYSIYHLMAWSEGCR